MHLFILTLSELCCNHPPFLTLTPDYSSCMYNWHGVEYEGLPKNTCDSTPPCCLNLLWFKKQTKKSPLYNKQGTCIMCVF